MDFEQKDMGEVTILKPVGDLMGGPEATRFNERVNQLLDEGKLKVVVDLSAVKRLNSSGLGILIKALTSFKQNGGVLKLAGATNTVQNLLAITKLDTIFETYDSTEAALNSFA